MGYNAFRGQKRPSLDTSGEPAVAANSAEEDSSLIAKIIAFAQNDAREAWVGLGLDSVPIPKVVLKKLKGHSTLMIDTVTGKAVLIALNSRYQKKWTEVEYAQVFIMENGQRQKERPASSSL